MNMFEIVLHCIYITICVTRVLKHPLFTTDFVARKLWFDWISFLWFALGLATFINLVYSLL